MARNEAEASELRAVRQVVMKANYKVDVVQRQLGDLQKQVAGIQDRMNRMEALLQGLVNSQARVSDLTQPTEVEIEMTRRIHELRRITLNSTQGKQWRGAPEGARNSDYASTQKIDMTEISTADIVLTTYDVLKEDLSHDFDRHDGDRHFLIFQKRYPVIPTILTRVHWWRLCLDEAQMVEPSKTSVTEMAMRLNAQHRWCITGTPIPRRLDDLFGLLHFLRTSPFDTYRWWVDSIRDPYERGDMIAMNYTHRFFRKIMWCSSKIHVSQELQLPPQEACFSWLIFSSIEEYFYQKQHATCMDHAHEIIRRLRNDANRREPASDSNALSNAYLSNNDIDKLLDPLQFSAVDSSHIHFILAASILRAVSFGIPIPDWAKNTSDLVDTVSKVVVPEFEPKRGVKIETDEKATNLSSASVDDAAVIEDLLTKLETRASPRRDRLVTQWLNQWGEICLRKMLPRRMLTSLKHLRKSLLLRRGQCQTCERLKNWAKKTSLKHNVSLVSVQLCRTVWMSSYSFGKL